ncbi:hypothetical protein E2C01_036858 [Portunus trituberculatus]|uniref:Uncharacterized protein n=1 Tax=Portunus trituberculatus TaxID=210409 RepID=A0A5B7FDT6_PORTR|nr:hypothetical protein [Portunus trituberculatus]
MMSAGLTITITHLKSTCDDNMLKTRAPQYTDTKPKNGENDASTTALALSPHVHGALTPSYAGTPPLQQTHFPPLLSLAPCAPGTGLRCLLTTESSAGE